MTKVKALQSLYGDYGQKVAGDEFEVADKVAALLAANRLVEIVSENSTPAPEPVVEKASVTISDNTTKEKKEISKPGK